MNGSTISQYLGQKQGSGKGAKIVSYSSGMKNWNVCVVHTKIIAFMSYYKNIDTSTKMFESMKI